jgi:hypothetical protein
MEISQGNTMENSGKQSPKTGFKSPPAKPGDAIVSLSVTYMTSLK